MSKLNFNQTITVTKKSVVIVIALMVVVLVIALVSLVCSLSNSAKISHNYQVVATGFNELENKVNTSNTMMDDISALEIRMDKTELEQKKITVDYDNLNTRTARHEQDIVLLQTVVNDKNLDSRLDNIEVGLKNNDIDIDSIKVLQRTQQITLDDMINAFDEFKAQIIQKITAMLTGKKNTTPNTTNQNIQVSKASQFPYVLSSIEFRSGEKWAVFSPKNIKSLSDLKFVNVGNVIDNWTVYQIGEQSVKLAKGKQYITLNINE